MSASSLVRSVHSAICNCLRLGMMRSSLNCLPSSINDLIFAFTGGGEPIKPPLYRLDIAVQVITAQIAIVDPFTDRPELQTAGIDAAFALVEIRTGQPVMSGNAIGRATYTRNRQRFASTRAERDAEDRAARIVVEQIRAKLMAHFSGAQPGT